MKIEDFAQKETHYTGANNKKKWVIKNKDILEEYFKTCNYQPSVLAKALDTSYSGVKRLLCAAGLWNLAKIRICGVGGRKRTAVVDQFGYKFADSSFDYRNERGEVIRRFEHAVRAEEKLGRELKDREVVHHVDLDKVNNNLDNLYICIDNKEHRTIHGQLERLSGELVRLGIIKFNHETGEYYINKEENEN